MENLRIYLPLVNGSQHALEFATGKELIHELISDDFGPPPRSLEIEARTKDGEKVTISIPYDDSNKVFVSVEKSIEE